MATPVPAVERAKRVLDLLASDPSRRFRAAEVSTLLDIHRASCFSLLGALVETGMVRRDPSGPTYSLGPALIRLGNRSAHGIAGYSEAKRQMVRLSTKLGLGCLVSCRMGDEIVLLDSLGDDLGRFRPGSRNSIFAPRGTIYVAWQDLETIREWLEESGFSNDEELRQSYLGAIAAIRARGYSVGSEIEVGLQLKLIVNRLSGSSDQTTTDEALLELADFARQSGEGFESRDAVHQPVQFIIAPIFDAQRDVLMTLTVFATGRSVPGERIQEIAGGLVDAANHVTASIGGASPLPRATELSGPW